MIFLMPIYFIIVLVIIYKLMKRYQGKHKWRHFLLLAFLFYLPVGWDVILGRAYFNYLCHKDGGIHIYQTVELGPEYWNEDGSPKFYTEKGDFDESFFDGRYEYITTKTDRNFRIILSVSRDLTQMIDTNTGNILGERVSYLYGNGWVMETWQPFSTSGQRCPRSSDYPTPSDYKDNPLVEDKGPRWYRKFHSYMFLNKDNHKQGR